MGWSDWTIPNSRHQNYNPGIIAHTFTWALTSHNSAVEHFCGSKEITLDELEISGKDMNQLQTFKSLSFDDQVQKVLEYLRFKNINPKTLEKWVVQLRKFKAHSKPFNIQIR